MPKFLDDVSLEKNQLELAAIHSNADPVANLTSPVEGQIAWDSTSKRLQIYNGSGWVAMADSSTYSIGAIEFFGHSGVYGGATTGNRGTDVRTCALLNADSINRSRGGARLSWHEPSSQQIGGWAHIFRHINPGSHSKPYISNRDVVVLNFNLNDLAQLGPDSSMNPFYGALTTSISRARAAAVFEETDSSVTYPSGTWSNNGAGVVAGSGNTLYASGGGYKSASSGSISIAVPSDFPGGTVALCFLAGSSGEGASVTFTVDGGASGSLDTRDKNAFDYGTSNTSGTNRNVVPYVKRFTGLSAGAHTIVATVGSVNTGCFFDCWWIEAQKPPIVVAMGGYNTSSADTPFHFFTLGGFPYTPTPTTLATMNTAINGVCSSFDNDVLFLDPDPILDTDPNNFALDHVHPSDLGHSLIAEGLADLIQGRARTRIAHSEGSGIAPFISSAPSVPERNVIEAQQNSAIPLVLKGRKPGDQAAALLRLDGSGSYAITEYARDILVQTDARVGVVDATDQVITGSAAGDLVIRADTGKMMMYGTSASFVGAGSTPSVTVTDGSTSATLGIFGVPYVSFGGDTSLYRQAADVLKTDDALVIGGAVTITSGSISGITDLAVADGGTGASSASGARSNLGLAFGTNHAVPSLSVLSTLAVTADRVYYAQLVIPADCTITGLRVYSSSAAGTCNSALYDSGGTRVANSTAATAVGSNVFNVPFDSTYVAAPGVYFPAIVFSGTPTMGMHYPGSNSGFVAVTPGSVAPPTSITPPTTVSSTRVVVMATY